MARDYDIDEILYLSQTKGMSAAWIKEELSLSITQRQLQRLIAQRVGRRPTRQAIRMPDTVRSRVVAYMESRGLDQYYCSLCLKRRMEPGFIHALNGDPSLDVLVFVCRHCSVASDR
ncbi:hypothetical protein [Curtobacterium sp. MCSS17_007]|uniref:hypothetical protein n=1 Tax=Curtobacterium sp. MCSS17_007 TaxID=2175646 RepID=UPI000DA78719|nr:hypothetical protein [Curtobacterium sp. MCSS17_007]WIE74513.1 hypothetical protein DEJ22_009480 [Curtobacterium sp. MCSS17_007]